MDQEIIPHEKVQVISHYRLRSSLKKSSKDIQENLDTSKESPDITLAPSQRRVSFAASSTVKHFVEDPDRNTIWDNTYEEEINSHVDSNNAISSDIASDHQLEVNFNETIADIEATLCEPDSMEFTECFDNVHVKDNSVLSKTIAEVTNMELTCHYSSGNIIVCKEDIEEYTEATNSKTVYEEVEMNMTCRFPNPLEIFKENDQASSRTLNHVASKVKTNISTGDQICIKSLTSSQEPVCNQTIVDMSFTCNFEQRPIGSPIQLIQRPVDMKFMSKYPQKSLQNDIPPEPSKIFLKNCTSLNEDMDFTCKFPQKSMLPQNDATSLVNSRENITANKNMNLTFPQKIFDNISTENLKLPRKSIVPSDGIEFRNPERSVQLVNATSNVELDFLQKSNVSLGGNALLGKDIEFNREFPQKIIPTRTPHINMDFADTEKAQSKPSENQWESNKEVPKMLIQNTSDLCHFPGLISKASGDHLKEDIVKDCMDWSIINLPEYTCQSPKLTMSNRPSSVKESYKNVTTGVQTDLIQNSLKTKKVQFKAAQNQQGANKKISQHIENTPELICKASGDPVKADIVKDSMDWSTIDSPEYTSQQPRPTLVKRFGNIPIAIDCTDASNVTEHIDNKINANKNKGKSISDDLVASVIIQDKTYNISSKESETYILSHQHKFEKQNGDTLVAPRSEENIPPSSISKLEKQNVHLENPAETKCDDLSDILTEEDLKDDLTTPLEIIYAEPLCKPSLSIFDFSLRSSGKKTPFGLSNISSIDGTQQLIDATFSKQNMEDTNSSRLELIENPTTGSKQILNELKPKMARYKIPQIDFTDFREMLDQSKKLRNKVRQHMEQKQRPSPRRSCLNLQVKRLSMVNSSFTNKIESVSDLNEESNSSIQLDMPKSLNEKILDVFHNTEDRLLKFERGHENKYVFGIFSGTTCVSVELHPDDGRVIDIDSLSTLHEESKSIFQSLHVFIVNYLLNKLQMSNLRSSLGIGFDMLSLLDHTIMITERCFDFCNEFIKAGRLYKTLNIHENSTVSFEILQVSPPVRWNIEFKMASVESFQQNSVKAQSNYGKISEEQLNVILMNTEPGIDCIGKFVESVLNFYKRTVIGRNKKQ